MSAWRAIGILTVAGLVVGAPGYAAAQGRPGVGIVTTLVGEATVTRAALAQDQALKKRDDVYPQDRITTKERSLVHVLMGGKALLTVRELSVVTVTEEAGRATVNLQSGKVGLAVVRERMRPGEVIEVHTPHAVAAVRGTVLVVEIVPGASVGDQVDAGGSSTNVHLLHGKLDVSLRSDPGAVPVRLESLQSVTVSSHALGAIRPLAPAAVTAVTASLRPNQPAAPALPEKFKSAFGERQQALAIATLEGLAGSSAVRKGQGAQARVTAKGEVTELAPARQAINVASDAGDGLGVVTGSALSFSGGGGIGSSTDGGNGTGGSGNSGSGNSGSGNSGSGSRSGGSGQNLGSIPATVLTAPATLATKILHKKDN